MRRLIAGSLASLFIVGAAAIPAQAQTAKSSAPTIAGIVATSGGDFDGNHSDYDLLLNAVKTAGLVDALNDPAAKLTVFAPNDRAFILLARDLGFEGRDEAGAWEYLVGALTGLGNGDPVPVLTNVLLYHVAPGALGIFDVALSNKVDTLLGASFGVKFVALVDAEPDLKNPVVLPLASNIKASNGIVHTISRVLLPINL
ncbi:MAG: fasciclin domain-containing protein [Acidimicrobiales bacterium]